ncbi:hypothetical protein FXO38_28704 [Capsicum annuum]|nr:hypothetical protein FXO38_28704 [Capsicum annuum]KAF3662392.1 hypothetical protein FXO37_12474 [Capsicum annuum]
MARVLPKFVPHIGCHTVNDIEDRIKAMLTKNQFKKFCTDSIFGVFMKKNNCVVQAQLERCIMSLETTESSTSDIVIRAKGTTVHFSLREFAIVIGLNYHSNRDDFGFDEDKKELFTDVTDKIWGNENNEDAIKFANLYFIHGFLLSFVDTVTIPRLHFDLIESDHYRDYIWGSVAYEELAKSINKKLKPTGKFYMIHGMSLAIQLWLYECCSAVTHTVSSKVDSQISHLLNWKTNPIRPRYESLMESLFNDSNDKVIFKNIEPTRKEISTFQIPKKVFHRGGSHKEDYVDSDDDFQDPPPKHQLSINKKKYQGDSSNSPTKKKLKNQSKGVDQHTPKRTPPSRSVNISSVKKPIFKVIQSKETVPSNRKDILVQSPDMSFFNREDEDDVFSKKIFEKFRDEPQLDETDKDTSPHESTPILHYDFDKSPEGTLDKIDTSVHEARDTFFGEGKSQPDLRDSQVTIPDELLPSLNEYMNLERSIIVHPSANKEQTPVNVSRIKRPSKFKESPFTTKFGSAEVEDKNWFYVMGTPGQSWSDEQVDVCLYYLRQKSKYEPNSSYMYSTVDCNFMNIVRAVLVVYLIDDPTLNAGGKEYHLNEYISRFRMHAAVPWHTVTHIFIPINIKSKHHWVLVVLSFNSRCIYVYDLLSYAGHDSAMLAEVEKLAEVIPYCLLACKFYEKKGIDIDNHPNYKLNDKHDLFDVYIMEDLPQQPCGSL